MKRALVITACLLAASPALATVFLNEVYINPAGSSADETREFVELLGTPGMKLDGYAIAFVNGALTKYYPLNSIPPRPVAQETDEFFSLDGLQLGPNGILVLGIGTSSYYPTLLADSNFRQWGSIWNGGLDTPGKLDNDGSNTILLIRNRPGRTQADPANPAGLRWGKDVNPDDEVFHAVEDPSTGAFVDQYGDGGFDGGQPNGIDGNTLDVLGKSTPDDASDDLEVVDEISYENDRGWEYDTDSRHVDADSPQAGLPPRHVHALDDAQGFNPDCLSRVDYRTSGPGWLPAPGAIGELHGGNNWQDTATEQWVRGESSLGTGGQGNSPQFFYNNAANTNPDAIQPYMANTPLWLNDGAAPDYNFAASNTYQIMAGRLNPLAVPFIPGDTDRDGDCDTDDIAKLAAVFGDDNWIFSNAFSAAPEGDGGDPATQTRPWDVDATGDNGIEASDLQWTLNFQGSTDGRIVGVRYDSTTPAATGVYLDPNSAVTAAVTLSINVPSGHTLNALSANEIVEITVRAQVTAGANTVAGRQNGVMQFVHDLNLTIGGVARVEDVTVLAPYEPTRPGLLTPVGSDGDRGATLVNGYTTSFTAGLTTPTELYRVTLRTVAPGTATFSVASANTAKFAAGTPGGLKVGHTGANGNPASVAYPAALTLAVTAAPQLGDLNGDGAVNAAALALFAPCLHGPGAPLDIGCSASDLDAAQAADLLDYAALQRAANAQ